MLNNEQPVVDQITIEVKQFLPYKFEIERIDARPLWPGGSSDGAGAVTKSPGDLYSEAHAERVQPHRPCAAR